MTEKHVVWLRREHCAWGNYVVNMHMIEFPSKEIYEKALSWFVTTPHALKLKFSRMAGYHPSRPSRWGDSARMYAMYNWAWEYHCNESKRIAELEHALYNGVIESAIEGGYEDHQQIQSSQDNP